MFGETLYRNHLRVVILFLNEKRSLKITFFYKIKKNYNTIIYIHYD